MVRIKLKQLNETEKLLLQEFCTAGNAYLRFTPIRGIGSHSEEELSVYRKNLTNKNIYDLLGQWKHYKRIYSSFVEQYAFKLYDIGVESELLNLWIEFKEGLKHKSRFAFTLNTKLKDALLNIMEINLVVIEENSILYRARNGAPSKFSAYKEKDIMCPPKELVGNGRINSKGIPYLYTASDAETAIAEVRPSKAVPVSVAKLATTKSHRFVKLDNVKFSTDLPLYIQ
ncbi:RES family NAD+ phosphorylase [Paenibacillus sp. VT-400]|uniref:RES family NAD+ phosphorylase n=1 Tax=Paenibacillus sp. VT-400 TaxID=1495853 RepID=UPI000A643984|nr:RES family NAD+ phosphorylase [Paenibacillus sp. VT-400]